MIYTSGMNDATTTTTAVTPPSGINAGDLVMLFMSKDGTGAFTTPAGWTLLAGRSGGANYLSVFYQTASGAIATFNVTHASEPTTWICVVLPGAAAPVISLGASGTTATPTPDQLTSGFPTETVTTWFALAGWDYNYSLSGYPIGFDSNQVSLWNGTTAGCGIAMATKESRAATENPSSFAIASSEQWAAYTIAVRFTYEPTGTYVAPAVDVTTMPESSRLKYNADTPVGTSATVEYKCNASNITAPVTGWIAAVDGDVLTLDAAYLWLKISLATNDVDLSPTVSALWVEEATADPNKIQISLTYAGRMKHPQGNVAISFNGSMFGPGNAAVMPFNESFLPVVDPLWFHPHDIERITVAPVMTVAVKEVFYSEARNDHEYITASASMTVVVTKVGALPL